MADEIQPADDPTGLSGLVPTPAADVYAGTGGGRPPQYQPEIIEAALWEVAVCGGNCAKALRNLQGFQESLEDARQAWERLPDQRTLRRWVTIQYRNRFHEIVTQRHRELEDQVAARNTERAIQLDEVEQDLILQLSGRISNMDGVEAAKALQAITAAKKNNLDGALTIRRQGQGSIDSRSIEQLAGALQTLGVGRVIDGTAVEDDQPEPVALVPGDV